MNKFPFISQEHSALRDHFRSDVVLCRCILDEHTKKIKASIDQGRRCVSWPFFENQLAENRKNNTIIQLSYELKDVFESLSSSHPDEIEFPLFSFVESEMTTEAELPALQTEYEQPSVIGLIAKTSKEKYIATANELLRHIKRGDIYEVNYCIEFYADHITLDPILTFFRLFDLTKAPHSCLYKSGSSWLMCASPERYLQRKGSTLISQPIKGTRARGINAEDDLRIIDDLKNDRKEISENVMIVDLVRNDLSKVAQKGSVKVEELCGIHTFQSVHQMISTISARVQQDLDIKKIIEATFPMGSMTGAPKIRAMEFIERYEDMRRGIYSGSVGILSPDGDFDLNVVIRSIEYNERTSRVAVKVGSAITSESDPEREYAECLLKAQAMFKALNAVLI